MYFAATFQKSGFLCLKVSLIKDNLNILTFYKNYKSKKMILLANLPAFI